MRLLKLLNVCDRANDDRLAVRMTSPGLSLASSNDLDLYAPREFS